MIMILEISESKGEEFSGYEFYVKKNTELFYVCRNVPLTRWLPTASILAAIGRIYSYQFKCNYLKSQKYFAAILLHFWNLN